ncbi:MAG: putative rane protein [Subtercola sp.]|nr:putative rane protein [Subtercola sp.]
MSTLSTLLKSADRAPRSSATRMIALVLAVATPLLVAGVAVSAFSNTAEGATGAPNLPAAIVNLDATAKTTVNGVETTVPAGKLLTTQLVSGQAGTGFSWTLTNADDAGAGLDSGAYSAVVTIPSNFSELYVSTGTSTPAAASLEVKTNGAQSYVAALLTSALATNVNEALSTSLTQSYVTGLLGGFTSIHDQLTATAEKSGELATAAGQVSTLGAGVADGVGKLTVGAEGLSSGLATASSSITALPGATSDLAKLSVLARDGSALLSDGLTDTAKKQDSIEARQLGLNVKIAELSTDLPTLTSAQVASRVADIKKTSDDIALSSLDVGLSLDAGALAGALLKDGNALISTGTTTLAESMPPLVTGIAAAAKGAGELTVGLQGLNGYGPQLAQGTAGVASGVTELSTGLGKAGAAVPTYTVDQQATIATVAATPVVTTVTDSQALPSAQVATASVMIPVALWLGAFALYLLLTPFTAQALSSSAGGWRILRQSLLPAIGLAVVQALAVIVGLQLIGVGSANPAGSALFILGLSVAFVVVHQGLIALFGRVGRMLSLAFLVLQVAAAGVLVPAALSPGWFQTLSSILPLSAAVRGMQGLLTGAGSDGGAGIGGVVVTLVVVTGLGVALTLVAISRRRSVTSLS